jgi:hypothetical protein
MNWPWNLNNEQHRWREAKEQWFKTLQSRAKKGAGGEKEGGTVDMFLVTCDNRPNSHTAQPSQQKIWPNWQI